MSQNKVPQGCYPGFPLWKGLFWRMRHQSHIFIFFSENIWVTLAWVTGQTTRNKWHVWYKWAHCPSLLDKCLYTQINSTFRSSADAHMTLDVLFNYITVVLMMTWGEQSCRAKPGSRDQSLWQGIMHSRNPTAGSRRGKKPDVCGVKVPVTVFGQSVNICLFFSHSISFLCKTFLVIII